MVMTNKRFSSFFMVSEKIFYSIAFELVYQYISIETEKKKNIV